MNFLRLLILIINLIYKEVHTLDNMEETTGICTRYYFRDYAEGTNPKYSKSCKLQVPSQGLGCDFGYLGTADHQETKGGLAPLGINEKAVENFHLFEGYANGHAKYNIYQDQSSQQFQTPNSGVDWKIKLEQETHSHEQNRMQTVNHGAQTSPLKFLPGTPDSVSSQKTHSHLNSFQSSLVNPTHNLNLDCTFSPNPKVPSGFPSREQPNFPKGSSKKGYHCRKLFKLQKNASEKQISGSDSETDNDETSAFFVRRRKGMDFKQFYDPHAYERINNVLKELKAMVEDDPVRVVSVQVLDYGTVIKIVAKSSPAANWLQRNLQIWGPMVDPAFKSWPYSYKIVLDELPKNLEFKNLMKHICESNQIKQSDFHALQFSKASSRKSMILCTHNAAILKQVEKEGISIYGTRVYGHQYCSKPEQCEKCLRVGHHYCYCRSNPRCSRCGRSHWSHKCYRTSQEPGTNLCYVCIHQHLTSESPRLIDYNDPVLQHSALSDACPTKLKAIAKFYEKHPKYEEATLREDYE
ncbi:hypothetical protein DFH28DRAFT_947601 [Melampsora americana]|nr:hypothetical protein DFH28DRAFT_947601 [Melampsora americana]